MLLTAQVELEELKIRTKILEYYFRNPGHNIYPSDIAFALKLPAFEVFEMTEKLKRVIDEITKSLSGNINKYNVMNSVVQGVIVMGKFVNLHGMEKKDLLIAALNHIVEKSTMNESDKDIVQSYSY